MARFVLLANHRSLWLWQDEWVILPTIPGAGNRAVQPLLPVAPETVAPPAEGGGPVTENSASSFTDRASTSSAGGRRRGAVHEGLREV